MIRCVDCQRELEHRDLQNAWQRVIGWEHRRKAGGTNALALREPMQVFCCAGCFVLKKMGAKSQQGRLNV